MSRAAGSANVGVRWDSDMEEFQLQCPDCARLKRAAFWPLTLEFWQPTWGMTRCRSCWNARKAATNRRRWRTDPVYRAMKAEANREQRRAQSRVMYALVWERLRADPAKYDEYRARRREKQREASARYRAKQREQVAA